jgi:hypothetical protein
MTPEQIQEITRLRSLNLSPKQIARKLGLRPSEVTAIIKNHAIASGSERSSIAHQKEQTKALPSLEKCLINEKAAQQLLDSPEGKGRFGRSKDTESGGSSGLAQLYIVRSKGSDQYLVCSYLVDYWCLGVKDTFGPRKMNRQKYQQMLHHSRQNFDQDFREITLEQAQSIVFGAVKYAEQCGLKPHPDFERSKPYLGEPPETLLPIEFGRDGKPFYMCGPYDNPDKIIQSLRENVGEGNFHYVI